MPVRGVMTHPALARGGPPLVAIGGITTDNGASLVDVGADWLAVICAVFDAPDMRAAAPGFSPLFASRTDTP